MVERQDIDALLISALYGELTPAEETRLSAHLESHPADRTALDDLTLAREAVQKSRILAFQYEPPQSVSALLIQEAARRAPKKAPEGEGWFARFVRSFVQHPAMAAAAMLVIVVGAAALVSRNSDTQFAETEPVETRNTTAPAMETVKPDVTIAAPTDPAAAPAAQGPTAGAFGRADTEQFKVGLADGETVRQQALAEGAADRKQEKAAEVGGKQKVDPKPAKAVDDGFYLDAGKDAPKVATKKPADTGLELRRREAVPKDLDASKETKKGVVAADSIAVQESLDGNFDTTGYRDQQGAGRGAGGAPGAAAPTAPPVAVTQNQGPRTAPPPAPPPPAKTVAKPTTAPRQYVATDTTTTTGSASRADNKDKDKADKNEGNKVANDPNLAWAKDQHAALVTAVRANNCGRAANLALSIANRAPAYYAQNVETDRSVKQCIAYINSERERDAEVRASRAKKSQLKNAEPSAPKRAADEPARATTTDSVK